MALLWAEVPRVVDGQAIEHHVCYDTLGLLAQLGSVPEPASA
jgi:hypothetical protein